MASHVVLLARIGKEVGLRASLDTGIEERQTMLGLGPLLKTAASTTQLLTPSLLNS